MMMRYTPKRPSFLGVKHYQSVDAHPILPYIDWTYFFHAWKVVGNFKGIEQLCDCEACKQQFLLRYSAEEREKASVAWRLLQDARQMLTRLIDERRLSLRAALCFTQARSEADTLILDGENGTELRLPMLRQQRFSERSGLCYALSDFISPKSDYIGLFCVSVAGTKSLSDEFRASGDDYSSILVDSVADRLVEAFSEWLHLQVRRHIWGYAPDEHLTLDEIRRCHYQGIRPAVGYPSLPDQSLIFEIGELLRLKEIGVELTENGAMRPNSSICGLYVSHPSSHYFMVGKIGKDQLQEYAVRRGKSAEEMRRWLVGVL